MNNLDFIAVEGVIGVGKTSLAQLLAERMQARLVLEEFEENPFLPKFYENPERYAFQTQLAFLSSRFQQQQGLQTQDLFHETTVTDYIFEKDRIFARLNLNEDELALYDRIYKIMSGIAPRPDVVIYLQASVDRLMENIRRRGRPYEHHITRNYLASLQNSYNNFFNNFTRSRVLFVNTTELDFVGDVTHLDYLEDEIFEAVENSDKRHIQITPAVDK